MNGLVRQDWTLRRILVMIFFRHPLLSLTAIVLCILAFNKLIYCGGDVRFSSRDLFSSHQEIYHIKNGSIETLSALLKEFPFTFVMFYAPWCGQSIKLVPEFIKTSKDLHGKVNFVAVNCWIGSCRQNHILDSFPKLLAYHTVYDGVEYPGPHLKWSMVVFLEGIIRPFVHVGSAEDHERVKKSHETWIISYFNFTQEKPKFYSVFFKTALLSLARVSKPVFAVITSELLADSIGISSQGQLLFYQPLHQSKFYPKDANYTSTSILEWLDRASAKLVTPLSFEGKKSDVLMQELNKTAVMILFLPLEDPGTSAPLLSLYKSLAVQYHNCSCDGDQSSKSANKQIKETSESDKHAITGKPSSGRFPWQYERQECISVKPVSIKRFCCLCYSCSRSCGTFYVYSFLFRFTRTKDFKHRGLSSLHDCVCLSSGLYYTGGSIISLCCSADRRKQAKLNFTTESARTGRDFAKALDNLLDSLWKTINLISTKDKKMNKNLLNESELKKKYLDGLKLPELVSPQTLDNNSSGGGSEGRNAACTVLSCSCRGKVSVFKGASCYTNKSVSFFYTDSGLSWSVAKRLGVQSVTKKSKPALVIVDIKNEAQFVHEESKQITNRSAVNFIMRFMDGNLTRRLSSAPASTSPCLVHSSRRSPCIVEVVQSSFKSIVLNEAKDVMLMYYAPWCVFCKSVASLYLALANYFKNSPDLVFARIDGESNDLSWDYKVQSYPTFIFYPAGRKGASVRFPDEAKRTLANFVAFVLRHSTYNAGGAKSGSATKESVKRLQLKIADLQDKLTEAYARQQLLESQVRNAVIAKQHALQLRKQAEKISRKHTEEKVREKLARNALETMNKQLNQNYEICKENFVSATEDNQEYIKEISALKVDAVYAKFSLDAKVKELEKMSKIRTDMQTSLSASVEENKDLKKSKLKLESQIQHLKDKADEMTSASLAGKEENSILKSRNVNLENQLSQWIKRTELQEKEIQELKNILQQTEQIVGDVKAKLTRTESESKQAKEMASEYKTKLHRTEDDFLRLSKKLEDLEIETTQN